MSDRPEKPGEYQVKTELTGGDQDELRAWWDEVFAADASQPTITVNGRELGRLRNMGPVSTAADGSSELRITVDPTPEVKAAMAVVDLGSFADAWACCFAIEDLAKLFALARGT